MNTTKDLELGIYSLYIDTVIVVLMKIENDSCITGIMPTYGFCIMRRPDIGPKFRFLFSKLCSDKIMFHNYSIYTRNI